MEPDRLAVDDARHVAVPVVPDLKVLAIDGEENPASPLESETGLLVPPGDEKALSEAMVGLLSDPARVERMGKSARVYLETELTPEIHAVALEAAYRTARGRHGRLPS